jgi:hypothetical protein
MEQFQEQSILRELKDGLILRRATLKDVERLVAFNGQVHSDEGPEKPDERVAAWTRDLMERPHPTFNVGDFTLVEDPESGAIVSSMCLISQTWRYEDIPFGLGRPELVGTLPEYRNRGLVRAQFEVIHRWSAERGELMQAITGIPYYYRIFGYEMGLSLGGGRVGFRPHIPQLKDGLEETYRIRPVGEGDLTFIVQLYREAGRRYPIGCVWDENLLRYELTGKSAANVNRYELRVIETRQGERVGFLAHANFNWGPTLPVMVYELIPGVSWGAVTLGVIRYLGNTGEGYAAQAKGEPFGGFAFWLGENHPVYDVIPDRLPRARKPYAWYLRVPDLPGFLRHIAPALERRLAASPLAGHSGELKITFYRSGLRLVFDHGLLKQVETWIPEPHGHSGDAGFPDLTFLQILFGYRSLDELKYAFADCRTTSDEAYALLNALFPRKPSDVWPIA